MKKIFTTSVLLLAILLSTDGFGQSADKITMRLRVVCNYGPGGDIVIAVDLKKGAGGDLIGGYAVLFRYNSSKMIFTATQPRYNQNYWGFYSDYFDNSTPNLDRWVAQQSPSPGNSLPLGKQYFSYTTKCNGDTLKDNYWELLRFVLKINGSAQGTADFLLNNWLAYKSGGGSSGAFETFVWNAQLNDNYNETKIELFNIVVPVELMLFDGEALPDGKVRLVWKTATETSNHGFEVQRKGGDQWQSVGFVRGAGDSKLQNDYSFIDPEPMQANNGGVVWYRLRQIDNDGTQTLSYEVPVTMKATHFALGSMYPNPVSLGSAVSIPYQLAIPGAVTLDVFNSLGQKVATLVNNPQHAAGYFNAQWNGAGLDRKTVQSGTYYCRMTASTGSGDPLTFSRRFTLLR